MATTTIQAWIEQLLELFQDNEPRNIINLDELGLFFKALPEKGLMEKEKKTKGGKKSKQRMTVMFIVASDGSFVFEPTAIWRSKGPRYFKSVKDLLRPMSVHYFSNEKAWLDSDIMESILLRLERKTWRDLTKVALFGTTLPSILKPYRQAWQTANLPFYPKIQHCNYLLTPISSGFLHKHRKLLVCNVVSRIDEVKMAFQITEDVHVLKAIT